VRSGLAPAQTLRRIGQVYVEQSRFVLPVALVLFVPLGLVEALAEHAFELESEDVEWDQIAKFVPALLGQVAATSVGEVFFAGVVMSAVTESMEGRPRAPLRALVRTIPFGGLIVVDLLFSLGLAFGIVLLVVPGLVFFARYVLAAPLLEVEHAGVRSAFRRSRSLARGHALALLLLLGGVWLATELLASYLRENGGTALGESLAADWAIAIVLGVLVAPFWAVALCVVTWRLLQLERKAAVTAA
jgi:hypothetical protein